MRSLALAATLALALGALAAPTTALGASSTFTSSPNQLIPDDGYTGSLESMASDTIEAAVQAGAVVTDVTLQLAIAHTWVGDLTVKLRSPAGTVMTVLQKPVGDNPPNNCCDTGAGTGGESANLSANFPISFNDSFTTNPEDMGVGLTSDGVVCRDDARCNFYPNPDVAVSPATLAAAFDGQAATGGWTLFVGDQALGDTGVIASWTLTIEHQAGLQACTTPPFSDVPTDHPFCPEIKWMLDQGITNGFPDGTYRPAGTVTRQAMSAFIVRFAGASPVPCTEPPFTDVPVDHSFCPEIKWMADQEVADGYPDGTFRPGVVVSRQAMAAFIVRLAGGTSVACSSSPFSDVATSHPFCPEIRWLKQYGVSIGYSDGTYRPAADMTRQAMAAFMYRVSLQITR